MTGQGKLIETFDVSNSVASREFDHIQVYEDQVVAVKNAMPVRTCHFQDYIGIKIVEMGSELSGCYQIIFLNGRSIKLTGFGIQHDPHRLLLSYSAFSEKKTNNLSAPIGKCIQAAFDCFKSKQSGEEATGRNESLDDLKKYKELLDAGVITQEDYDALKKKILNL